jgi:hypothetical protein
MGGAAVCGVLHIRENRAESGQSWDPVTLKTHMLSLLLKIMLRMVTPLLTYLGYILVTYLVCCTSGTCTCAQFARGHCVAPPPAGAGPQGEPRPVQRGILLPQGHCRGYSRGRPKQNGPGSFVLDTTN